jgi:UDP-N-acetylenolpyruvoylglucosamine reductase
MAAILRSARVLLADGSEADIPVADLGLSYRDSRFKHPMAHGPAELVVEATFGLETAAPTAPPVPSTQGSSWASSRAAWSARFAKCL